MPYDAIQICLHANVPAFWLGPPGVGKTSIIRAICQQLGWPLETVIASICEPSDLGGLPVVDNGGVNRVPPAWAQNLAKACSDGSPGVMFFDELPTAAPANQAAVLRISQERVVGDLHLPQTVRFVAAGNPVDESAGGWDLSAPLANRLCHLRWETDTAAWVKGMQTDFPSPTLTLPSKEWRENIGQYRSLISSFIRAQPHKLVVVPKEDSQKGHAWPSPRTWHMGSILMACAHYQPVAVKAEVLAGCVGDGAAHEFLGWLDRLDLPRPELVLDNPKKFYKKPKQDEEHRSHAILGAALSVAQQKPGVSMWNKSWELLAHAAQWNADVAVSFVPLMADMQKDGWKVPDVAKPFLKRMGKSVKIISQ